VGECPSRTRIVWTTSSPSHRRIELAHPSRIVVLLSVSTVDAPPESAALSALWVEQQASYLGAAAFLLVGNRQLPAAPPSFSLSIAVIDLHLNSLFGGVVAGTVRPGGNTEKQVEMQLCGEAETPRRQMDRIEP